MTIQREQSMLPRRIAGALLLLIAGIMLGNRANVFLAATYLSLLPVGGLGLVLLFSCDPAPLFDRTALTPWRAVLSAAAALLWLLMLSFFELYNSRIFSPTYLAASVYPDSAALARFYCHFHRFVYLPAVCISAWALLALLFSRQAAAAPMSAAPALSPIAERERRRIVWRCWTLIAVFTVFGVCCVYPMYNVSDVATMKRFVDSGEWNAWHTMGYLLFVRMTSLGGANYFLTVIAQGGIFAYASYTALAALSRQANARRACTVYTLVSLVSFLPYLYCSIMYKDTLFLSCMLGLCVALNEILLHPVQSPGVYVRLGLFGLGASLVRLGTFPLVALALIGLLLVARKRCRTAWIRTAVTTVALVCCYGFFNHLLPDQILHATPSPGYVKYTVPLGMIGAVAASGAPIDDADRAVIEQLMPYEEWAAAYNPYFMDPVSRTDEVIGDRVLKVDALHLGPDLLRLNAKFLLRYPRIYLTAFFNANSIVWEWGRPDDGRAAEWNWMVDFARKPMEASETTVQTQIFGFTGVMTDLAESSYRNVLTSSLFWRGGASLFTLILCAIVFCLRRQAAALIALLPPLGYSAMLMLSIPSQDPRYILPALVTATFFGASVFTEK